MLGSVDRPKGVSAVEDLNTKFGAARFAHVLLDKRKARVKGKDSDPSHCIRIGEAWRPNPTSKLGHLSKLKPNTLTNCPEQWGQSLCDAEGGIRGCS